MCRSETVATTPVSDILTATMSFAVRLAVDTVPIESGATVPCALEVSNQGSERERFELSVEGVDLEPLIAKMFADDAVAYLHAHNARRGCFAARVDRG